VPVAVVRDLLEIRMQVPFTITEPHLGVKPGVRLPSAEEGIPRIASDPLLRGRNRAYGQSVALQLAVDGQLLTRERA
jgi:hypothetical protein